MRMWRADARNRRAGGLSKLTILLHSTEPPGGTLEISEIAFFDTYPASGGAEFRGAWSVYPYLPSGIILVSDISNGLFVLTMQ